jgi:hypothetical protein
MAVVDGLLGQAKGGGELFWGQKGFHDVMFPRKQSHDCLKYR